MTTVPPLPVRPVRPRRHPFLGLLASERIKLTSLASMRWLAALVLLLGVLGAVVPANSAAGSLVNVGAFSGAAVGLLATLASCGEFATGTIRTTLTSEPRRLRALAAKTAVLAIAGVVLGLVSAAIAFPLAPVAAREDVVGSGYLGAAIGLAVFYASVAAFMAFVGVVVRRVPVAVTIAVLFLFLTPALVGGVVIGDHVFLSDFTLSEAGLGLVAPALGSALWQDVLVTLGWPTIAGVVAALSLKGRDV